VTNSPVFPGHVLFSRPVLSWPSCFL